MADNIITSVTKGKIPLPIPDPTNAAQAFDNLVAAWKECSIITEHEKTKRAQIKSERDVSVKAIEENSKLLKLYLEKTFAERAETIQGMFELLDKGLESGKMDLASDAISAIVDITKQSPLAGARELISSIHDPNVKMIEI